MFQCNLKERNEIFKIIKKGRNLTQGLYNHFLFILLINAMLLSLISFETLAKEPGVNSARLTILSDQVASRRTLGEWGFSAFIELDLTNGQKKYILFDTGDKPDTVIFNTKAIKQKVKGPDGKDKEIQKIDFADPKFLNNKIDIVISHHHSDHTKGLEKILDTYPDSFGKIHIGSGALDARFKCTKLDKPVGLDRKCLEIDMFKTGTNEIDLSKQTNTLYSLSQKYSDKFIVHKSYESLWPEIPGVWVTGYIPANSPEDNTGSNNFAIIEDLKNPNNQKFDTVPEEIALVIKTQNKGIMLVTGCGHRGIVNTLRHVNTNSQENTIGSLIGGIHLLAHDMKKLEWTANELNKFKLKTIVGSHCTGIERLMVLRKLLRMTEVNSPVGSVETVYDTSKDIAVGFPSPTMTDPVVSAK